MSDEEFDSEPGSGNDKIDVAELKYYIRKVTLNPRYPSLVEETQREPQLRQELNALKKQWSLVLESRKLRQEKKDDKTIATAMQLLVDKNSQYKKRIQEAEHELKQLRATNKRYRQERKNYKQQYNAEQQARSSLLTKYQDLRTKNNELEAKDLYLRHLQTELEMTSNGMQAQGADLVDLQQNLEEKNKELSTKKADLEQLQGQLETTSKGLEAKYTNLKKVEAALLGKTDELDAKTADLTNVQVALQEKTEELEARDAELKKQQQELEEKEQELLKKNTDLQQVQRQLGSREGVLEANKKELRNITRKMTSLEEALALQKASNIQTVEALDRQLKTAKSDMSTLQACRVEVIQRCMDEIYEYAKFQKPAIEEQPMELVQQNTTDLTGTLCMLIRSLCIRCTKQDTLITTLSEDGLEEQDAALKRIAGLEQHVATVTSYGTALLQRYQLEVPALRKCIEERDSLIDELEARIALLFKHFGAESKTRA